jgi:aryl-alcohol dehydrogenase-like predicted oxidoreductase
MKQRELGRTGESVSAIGLGCMSMSGTYGVRDDEESVRTVHRALDLGVAFIDTAEAYGNGHNEELLGRALAGRRRQAFLATKFGNFSLGGRNPDGKAPKGTDYVRAACEGSLRRLGTDYIDLYYLHRVDQTNPIEEVVAAMAKLRDQGKIRYLGLSEAGPATLRRAHGIAPIAALQSEYSLWTRDIAEQHMLPLCRELGIAYVAYSPLGRGFLTATVKDTSALPESDRRRVHPRFQGEHLGRNLTMLPMLEALATQKRCTPAQLALAWVLHRGDDIVPIPGTKRRTWLEQNVAALDIALGAAELAELDRAFPPGITSGTRYPESEMHKLML